MLYLRAVVRFMGFILAILVAVAALTPCCTGEEHGEDAVASAPHDTREGDDGCRCSPFFACATCAGFISTAQPLAFPAPVAYLLQYFEATVASFPSAYLPAPWQPPRAA